MLTDLLHISIKRPVTCPKDKVNLTLSRISNKLFQIEFWYDIKQVCITFYCPAVIENDILDTVFCSKIYEILICVIIDAGAEIDSIQVPVVPPVPCDFTRLHPAPVLVFSRSCKIPDHIVFCHLDVVFRHAHHPPRERCRTVKLRDIIFTALDKHLEIVIATVLEFLRICRIESLKRRIVSFVDKVHARIIQQVRLCNGNLLAGRAVNHQRNESDPFLVPIRKRKILIQVLEST